MKQRSTSQGESLFMTLNHPSPLLKYDRGLKTATMSMKRALGQTYPSARCVSSMSDQMVVIQPA